MLRETMRRHGVTLAAVIAISPSTLHAQNAAPILVNPAYNDRLQNAPDSVKAELKALEAEGKEKGWTFSVGYTGVFDIPLDVLAGIKIPENISEIAEKQNCFAKEAADLLRSVEGSMPASAACSPAAASFDWRHFGKVTPVKMQKLEGRECRSCWAFSALSAYESSYLIKNSLVIDVSEQHVLNCAGIGNCIDGGFPADVFRWISGNAVTDETVLPYHAADEPCPTFVPAHYQAENWNFVRMEDGLFPPLNQLKRQIPPVRQLKQAICDHGPISVLIAATPALKAHTGGNIFNESDTRPTDHAVTLIGWDDANSAWIVKNSWGTQWGDEGYALIRYESNGIGDRAVWVDAVSPAVASSPDISAKLAELHKKYDIPLVGELNLSRSLKVPPAPIP